MEKKLMTEETRLKLIEYTAVEIQKRSKSLDQTIEYFKLIGQLKKVDLTTNQLEDISRILEFKILIGFISLDLTTCVRSYLKAEFQYEGLYFLRQFTVIINEGYKKIYSFKKTNHDGTELKGNRAKSFWIKDISRMVKERNNQELLDKFNKLTNRMDKYLEKNFEGIKETRDIAIHYDSDLFKVYNTVINLNSNNLISDKFVPFYKLLDSIFLFSHELFMSYKINRTSGHD